MRPAVIEVRLAGLARKAAPDHTVRVDQRRVEFADVPCEHRVAVLDPLQIQDRVVQERLLAPEFYVRQARSGPGQIAGRAQRAGEEAVKRCRMLEMVPLVSASTRPVRLSRGIEAREHMCQLCKDNTRMIGEAHRQQAFDPLRYATLLARSVCP